MWTYEHVWKWRAPIVWRYITSTRENNWATSLKTKTCKIIIYIFHICLIIPSISTYVCYVTCACVDSRCINLCSNFVYFLLSFVWFWFHPPHDPYIAISMYVYPSRASLGSNPWSSTIISPSSWWKRPRVSCSNGFLVDMRRRAAAAAAATAAMAWFIAVFLSIWRVLAALFPCFPFFLLLLLIPFVIDAYLFHSIYNYGFVINQLHK